MSTGLEKAEPARELLAVLEAEARLTVEYVHWRQRAGMLPTAADCLRLRRWRQQAARHGVMFAPWDREDR